jgi:methyltransferase (TIGR00027 family)
MNQGRFSATAFGAAIQRAVHQTEPKPILIDPIVGRLLATIPRPTEGNVRERFGVVNSSVFVLRSRYAEDELEAAAKRGVGQYVILGAGFDTFAYRQPGYARDLTIYEVDHPVTQQGKREALQAAGIELPSNLRWAPIDFERQTLDQGLATAGFDANRPAFFSWLGVTQYLTLPAIEATLAYVASLPAGSTIVLTFVLPDSELQGDDLHMAVGGARGAASIGEPWLTRLRPSEIDGTARSLGFSEVEHLSPEAATARYFAGREDGLQAMKVEQLIRLTV